MQSFYKLKGGVNVKEVTFTIPKVPEDVHIKWKMAAALTGSTMSSFALRGIEAKADSVLDKRKELLDERTQKDVRGGVTA